MKEKIKAEWILRIAVFGIFLGHGVFGLQGKESWIPYFTSVGITESTAIILLPLIGSLDIIIALFALFYPIRIVLIWASFWGFLTALIRPISGEPIWDFVERAGNWGAPLTLLYLRGIPKKINGWFR